MQRSCRAAGQPLLYARHGMGTAWHVCNNFGGRPARVRLLPPATRTFTKVVDQNVTAFWGAFNCSDVDADCRLCGVWTELKVQSAFVLLLWCVSIVCSSLDYPWETTVENCHISKYSFQNT